MFCGKPRIAGLVILPISVFCSSHLLLSLFESTARHPLHIQLSWSNSLEFCRVHLHSTFFPFNKSVFTHNSWSITPHFLLQITTLECLPPIWPNSSMATWNTIDYKLKSLKILKWKFHYVELIASYQVLHIWVDMGR